MSRYLAAQLCLIAVVSAMAAGAAVAPAAVAIPRSFFGVVPQGPVDEGDFALMRGVIGTIRVPVGWPEIEPSPGEYDFTGLDRTVLRAAAAGIRVLPFVSSTPPWLTRDAARPPLFSAEARNGWASFLRRLVGRYGPRGDLWRAQARRMPIRQWQIWNEPNFILAWHPRPSPRGYARLLRASARAIRGVDGGAQIVAAGVAPVTVGVPAWAFLRKMYEVPGVRHDFDAVAVHPYAPTLTGVGIQVRQARRVMSLAGDGGKSLLVTELGVASDSVFPTTFDRGKLGQALFVRRAFELLLRQRERWHIGGVDWFTWRDYPVADRHCVFCQYAGLLDLDGRPKPAWRAFRSIALHANQGMVR